jgi:hypothetical protein
MAAWSGWAQDVLKYAKWPITTQNVLFLDTWQTYEGGTCRNNPLNTTLKTNRSTNCVQTQTAGVWVQNYPSQTAGKTATVSTLTGPFYGAIVDALKSGDPFSYPGSQTVAQEIRTWGTGNFATWYLTQIGVVGSSSGSGIGPVNIPGAVAPSGHHGYADLRNTVNAHIPTQLARSQALRMAALRTLAGLSKVGK